MKFKELIPLVFVGVGADAVCAPSVEYASWPFDVSAGWSYSCKSSAGGTNDLGTAPQPCMDDPASVRIAVTQGKAECLVASASNCKIPMRDFISLDYDFTVEACMGVWAAPLWMTPDTWQWGGGSGEIDSLEFCARDAIYMNFAGGGHQVGLDADVFSIDGSDGHITVRKDPAGIVTVAACTALDASLWGGQCLAPQYSDCNECFSSNNTYACWCNESANNIYGSGGCIEGTDCMWTLVSDIWNGVSGDEGYYGCMTAVPSISLEAAQPNMNSSCAFSVENIVVRGGGPNQSIQWGEGSSTSCNVLTTDPSTFTKM